jgi:hypothetical protein
MKKRNNKTTKPQNQKAQRSKQISAKGKNAPKAKKEVKTKDGKKPKKLKKKLSEHTAFKNKDKPKTKSRKAVRLFGSKNSPSVTKRNCTSCRSNS